MVNRKIDTKNKMGSSLLSSAIIAAWFYALTCERYNRIRMLLARRQARDSSNKSIEKELVMYKIGDYASMIKTFSDEEVRVFAEISGDKNPIHLDDGYAAETRFGKRLVHGILTSGMISAVLGMQLPGPGSVYIKQTLNFRAPVYIGDTITASVTVTKIREDKPIIKLETVCENQEGTVVIDGEAVLLAPS